MRLRPLCPWMPLCLDDPLLHIPLRSTCIPSRDTHSPIHTQASPPQADWIGVGLSAKLASISTIIVLRKQQSNALLIAYAFLLVHSPCFSRATLVAEELLLATTALAKTIS